MINLKALTIAAGLGLAMTAGAANAQTFTYSTDGTWTDSAPSSAITTSADGKTISWGNSTGSGQSSYVFADAAGTFDIADDFKLGTFTHNNFPVTGTTLGSTTLSLDLMLDSLVKTFTFDFLHDETTNQAPCNPTGTTVCPDVVSFLDNGVSTESIELGGIEYNLSLTGFLADGSSDLVEKFVTEEGQANTAHIFAKLTKVPTESVPEPMTLLGLVSVGGVATLLKRKQQTA